MWMSLYYNYPMGKKAMEHKEIEEEASYYLQKVGSIIYNRRENALNNCIKEAFIAGAEWAINKATKPLHN